MLTGTAVRLILCLALVGMVAPAAFTAEGRAEDPRMLEHRGITADAAEMARLAHLEDPADVAARIEYAGLLYELGRFEETREVLSPLLDTTEPGIEALMLMGRLEYLSGDYPAAERYLNAVLALDPENVPALAKRIFLHYQTGEFERIAELPEERLAALKIPHMDLMLAFEGSKPYEIDWRGRDNTSVRFLATDPLPIVEVTVEGRTIKALIDTGADSFVLDPEIADSLGVETVASMMGMFGGGQQAELGFGILGTLEIGDIGIRNVPVSLLPTKRFSMGGHTIGGIIGTGLLKQGLSTMDYPNGRLILRDPAGASASRFYDDMSGRIEDEVPFYLESTHFLMAHGSLNGYEDLLFHVDSGLAGEPSFSAPLQTLEYVGIPEPEVEVSDDCVGGGGGVWASGTFPIETLCLGELSQDGLVGEYGAMPPQAYRMLRFIKDGTISHGFLRQYAWTLDFSRMKMVFTR